MALDPLLSFSRVSLKKKKKSETKEEIDCGGGRGTISFLFSFPFQKFENRFFLGAWLVLPIQMWSEYISFWNGRINLQKFFSEIEKKVIWTHIFLQEWKSRSFFSKFKIHFELQSQSQIFTAVIFSLLSLPTTFHIPLMSSLAVTAWRKKLVILITSSRRCT